MDKKKYKSPVNKLLSLGEPKGYYNTWPNYLAEYGLKKEHIPELISLATDEKLLYDCSDLTGVYAPFHAWRSLGQLRATEAIEPLLTLLGIDDDLFHEDIPLVFGMIGEEALPALLENLGDTSRYRRTIITISECVTRIGIDHPTSRDRCLAILTDQLKNFSYHCPSFNAFVISGIIDLKGVESIEVIREAYESGCVDPMVCGNIERVEIALGLRKKRADGFSKKERGYVAPPRESISFKKPEMPGRNDPCPCGSGKKYKKCCE